MRRVRRYLGRGAALVALGAATTVGVAWGTALAIPATSARYTGWAGGSLSSDPDGDEFVRVHAERSDAFGTTVLQLMSAPDAGDTREPVTGSASAPTLESLIPWGLVPACHQRLLASMETSIVARGWPFAAAWCEYQVEIIAFPVGDWGPITRGEPRGGIPLPGPRAGRFEPGLLPLHPLLPGLLADTALYSAAWSGLLFGVPALRRWRRRRRNLCAKCGYDLSGTTGVCPECGCAEAC